MKLSSVIMIGVLILASSSAGSGQRAAESQIRSYVDSSIDADLKYVEEAKAIKELLGKSGLKADARVIVKTLKAIDKNVAKFYPNGPFTRNDFIALAWLESAFHQHEVGTHGEYGIFQIMPSEFKAWKVKGNFFDINTNTLMAFRVFNGKYEEQHDYKKTIQAYNGVVKLKNGKWSEKYWKAFQKRKTVIDTALAG